MSERRSVPHRKGSFRAGYPFAILFSGIAAGFLLSSLAQTFNGSPFAPRAERNHGPDQYGVEAGFGFLNTKSQLPTLPPINAPSARYRELSAVASTKPAWISNEELHNPETADPMMSALAEEEEGNGETSIADAVYRQIEELHLDGETLASLLKEFTRITPEDIPPGVSIQEFAARVAAIAAKDIWSAGSRGSLNEDPSMTGLRFGTSPRQAEPIESPKILFSTHDTRIFAVFDTSTYWHSSVFLKWYRIDQPELFILQKYEINPSAACNYIWYKREEGWFPGKYRVEVYSLGESFRMISSGQYEVW